MKTVAEIYRNIFEKAIKGTGKAQLALELPNVKNSYRVGLIAYILEQYDLLPTTEALEDKSLQKSLELRNAGNRSFVNKDDKTALALYTKSIAATPFPTNEGEDGNDALAIAFANRSAVLYSLGKYELCLRDISQALKYNYPNKLLYKLFNRQGQCLHHLGRKKEALKSINNALKWLPSAIGLTQTKKQTLEAELKKLLKCSENEEDSIKTSTRKLVEVPTCSYGKNHEIPCASDCVELKYSPEWGRYISATRNILPGDVLLVEKSFVSVLFPKNFQTHCYNCMQYCEALLPCCFCSNVMFCSEECRSSSWNNTHNIDCSILSILQKLELEDISYYILALKIVVMACKTNDLKKLLTSLEDEKTEERNKGFNYEGRYCSSEYGPIYWMKGHIEERKFGDLLYKSVIAAIILHYLESLTDFFSNTYIKQFKSDIGGLLLRHIDTMCCNTHEVVDYVTGNTNPSSGNGLLEDHDEVGIAVYPALYLVNHSCDPNVARCHYRPDTIVLRAIRSIAAGDQVFDTYGVVYSEHTKEERRCKMESYFFICTCNACVEDWPTVDILTRSCPILLCEGCTQELLPVVQAFLMRRKTIICTRCNKTNNIQVTLEKIIRSEELECNRKKILANKDDTDWNILAQEMTQYLMFLEKNFKRPNAPYIVCQELIKQCYRKSVKYV